MVDAFCEKSAWSKECAYLIHIMNSVDKLQTNISQMNIQTEDIKNYTLAIFANEIATYCITLIQHIKLDLTYYCQTVVSLSLEHH